MGPSAAERDEPDLAQHRGAGLVPELAGHVAVVAPRLAGGAGDDRRHHLRHVDLAEPLVQHHQRLRAGRERLVVQEGLGVHPLVPRVGEPLVTLRNRVVDVGRDGVAARNRFWEGDSSFLVVIGYRGFTPLARDKSPIQRTGIY